MPSCTSLISSSTQLVVLVIVVKLYHIHTGGDFVSRSQVIQGRYTSFLFQASLFTHTFPDLPYPPLINTSPNRFLPSLPLSLFLSLDCFFPSLIHRTVYTFAFTFGYRPSPWSFLLTMPRSLRSTTGRSRLQPKPKMQPQTKTHAHTHTRTSAHRFARTFEILPVEVRYSIVLFNVTC